MTKQNDEIFRLIEQRKAASDQAAAEGRAEAERKQAAHEAARTEFEKNWTNVRRLINIELKTVNEKLGVLDSKLVFGEEDLPRRPVLNWAIHFTPTSQHLKKRYSAYFIRHEEGTIQVSYKRSNAINIDEDRSFKAKDFTADDAHTLVNVLLNLAFGD